MTDVDACICPSMLCWAQMLLSLAQLNNMLRIEVRHQGFVNAKNIQVLAIWLQALADCRLIILPSCRRQPQ